LDFFQPQQHLSRKISFGKATLNLRLEKNAAVSLSQPKELSVSLGPIKHKLEDVQTKLNKCGLTHLIIKLITSNVHQEVSVGKEDVCDSFVVG
jgi:hypothetical protein